MESQQLFSGQLSLATRIRIRQLVPQFQKRAQIFRDARSLYREALTLVKFAFPASQPADVGRFATYLVELALTSGAPEPQSMIDMNDRLLALQEATQMESRKFQTVSNVSKTRHDIVMNTIRNMK